MKKATKSIFRIIISIIYIIWGITAPLTAIRAILDLNVPAILSATVGVLMLLAGIFGLIGMKKIKCRIFGIVIFVFAVATAVTAVLGAGITASISPIITALLAWLFIVCI